MKWLAAIWSELAGLFVDDAAFAAAIVGWLVVCGLLMRAGLPAPLWALILPAGLIAILVWSAADRARR